MSLKILLDPIYSGHPDRCSSFFKCVSLIDTVLNKKGRTDVFFYLMFPRDWDVRSENPILNHPNVKVIEYPYLKDRMREYMRYPDELDSIQAFNGEYWDFDLVFTSRTSMTPITRSVMSSPRQKAVGRLLKKVVVFEEMIIMDFRPTVAKSDPDAQELMTLTGYLAADKVFINTKLEEKAILQSAKMYLSPAKVRELMGKLVRVLPLAFRQVKHKAKEFRYTPDREFNVAFTGRIEKVSSNLQELYDIMTKSWVWNSNKGFKFMVCTVSEGIPLPPPDFVDLRRPNREEFWRIAREEMDVMISMHDKAEFSLSIVEPVMLGVPLIVIDQEWSRSIFGDDYPFYAKNATEAYGWISQFQKDYVGTYTQFAKWQQTTFAKTFTDGTYGCLYEETYKEMLDLENTHHTIMREKFAEARLDNAQMKLIVEAAQEAKDFVLFDLIRKLGDEGKLDVLADKIADGDRNRRRIVFATPWNEIRYILKEFYDFEDASTTTGHMRLKNHD